MIDYKLLSDSIEYYSSTGYQQIETPWTVTKEIANITAPRLATYFTIEEKNKVLVASAEQGYLYLANKGFLPRGKFQSVSPCFRDESFDIYHTKYFIKNELIITDQPTTHNLKNLVENVFSFFQKHVPDPSLLKIKQMGEHTCDIEYDGIELGSYGIRRCAYLTYIFGTGLALPRFSRAIKKYGVS